MEKCGAAAEKSVRLISLDRSRCDDCGKCAEVCYQEALFVSGSEYTVDRLFQHVAIDLPFYRTSGGGVTLSGGEPMSQWKFSTAFLKRCREASISTALDTTGYAEYEKFEAILPYTELFLYDLKHMEGRLHKKVAGVDNELILSNARKLALAGARFHIRIPVIPGFNAYEKNIRATGKFCQGLGEAVEMVQLLPYHSYGIAKYERLQRKYLMPDTIQPPTEEEMADIAGIMREYVPHVTIH
jgi:pyruvate formate lyase activating enzyme